MGTMIERLDLCGLARARKIFALFTALAVWLDFATITLFLITLHPYKELKVTR
jgi:hypothetical protein